MPHYPASDYQAAERDDAKIRAFRDNVLEHLKAKGPLVDVRSPAEYSGKKLAHAGVPERGRAARRPHPGRGERPLGQGGEPRRRHLQDRRRAARNLYENEAKIKPDDDVIVYCRIGERSSHTWFVLTHLLGYKKVRNYDGSWTEWGNLVGVPIER